MSYVSLAGIHVRTLLPGLWDADTHYYGARRLSIDAFYTTPPAVAGARAAHDLTATLNAGFTSVRELGGWSHQVAEAVAEGQCCWTENLQRREPHQYDGRPWRRSRYPVTGVTRCY